LITRQHYISRKPFEKIEHIFGFCGRYAESRSSWTELMV
jgi:hypothetical protein